ncbi:MAG: hypothetical protein NVS3B25_35530 [Hymenobacter sp.]
MLQPLPSYMKEADMTLLLRYVFFALANIAYLALVLWLLLFACTYLNPFLYGGLMWDLSGTHRPEPLAASLVAFGMGVAEALALLLLQYPANKRILRKATPSAAAVARWTCAASWAIAGIMVYGMAFDWLRSSR